MQRADVLGGRTFAMRIWLKPDRMAALNVSPAAVRKALANNNYLAALGKAGDKLRLAVLADAADEVVLRPKQAVVRFRLQETREATKMVDQMLEGLPAGSIQAKVPRIIKVPAGEAWAHTENPLGEMGYYVVSQGGLGPFRCKIRSASFNNVSVLPWVLRGTYVPDIITILASLYFILGDIDR